ncbi:MAG: glycosyltransferase family 4 protein, partial [Thermoplasmata archaeon]|nr:glycosyltransferase family 4 protein [Thermoplasmata archaeon]
TPAILGKDGASTHITEVWKRMPKNLDIEVHLVIIEGKKYDNISNIEDLKIIELPLFFPKIKELMIKVVLYQIWAFIYCLFLKNIEFIYTRYTTINIADILISKIRNIPLITEVNGIYKLEERQKGIIKKKLEIILNEILGRILFKNSTRIITVTDNLKKILIQEYKVRSNKIEVVNNGVNTKLFHPMKLDKCRDKLKIDKQSNVICFVGNLDAWQGVEDLINSSHIILKKVPNTIFLIVGSGALENKLKEEVKKLKITQKFIFIGWVQYLKIPIYINTSDVCVVLKKNLPIGYSPLKLYEYMACGKPVIATNISGLDIIEKYQTGLTVNPKHSKEVANAIIKLLKNNNLREQMGKNGRKLVLEKYTWEINATEVSNICKEFI